MIALPSAQGGQPPARPPPAPTAAPGPQPVPTPQPRPGHPWWPPGAPAGRSGCWPWRRGHLRAVAGRRSGWCREAELPDRRGRLDPWTAVPAPHSTQATCSLQLAALCSRDGARDGAPPRAPPLLAAHDLSLPEPHPPTALWLPASTCPISRRPPVHSLLHAAFPIPGCQLPPSTSCPHPHPEQHASSGSTLPPPLTAWTDGPWAPFSHPTSRSSCSPCELLASLATSRLSRLSLAWREPNPPYNPRAPAPGLPAPPPPLPAVCRALEPSHLSHLRSSVAMRRAAPGCAPIQPRPGPSSSTQPPRGPSGGRRAAQQPTEQAGPAPGPALPRRAMPRPSAPLSVFRRCESRPPRRCKSK